MHISNINFGYRHFLKRYFLEGKLPSVKIGLYGGTLTPDNVTIEHINPASDGGGTSLENIALATRINNMYRDKKPLEKVLTKKILDAYLAQFVDVDLPNLNGKKYIEGIRKRTENIF